MRPTAVSFLGGAVFLPPRLGLFPLLLGGWLVVGLEFGAYSAAVGAEPAPAEGLAEQPNSAALQELGATIYRKQCAACHGDQGEGGKEYRTPLTGDKPVRELAKIIAETMPDDDPEACVGEEAHAVAAYIYDAFYSPIAQQRNKPARVALSRLTVRQYRHALADLIGDFRSPAGVSEEHGLRGEYYRNRRFRGNERVAEQVDAAIRFQFADRGPLPGKIDPKEYGIRWEGSFLAPETGEYEFNVITENAARLWINDPRQPLLDAWVRSGDDKNHTEKIWLLGGRRYYVKLEFNKSEREKTGSVELWWKPPHHQAALLPTSQLSPARVNELFVVDVPFPPDDASEGYARGVSISQEWDAATTEGAIAAANYVLRNLNDLAGLGGRGGSSDDAQRRERLQDFCARFVERAFRRPLDDAERRFYIESQFAAAATPEDGVARVVLLSLKSPRFLYLDPDPSTRREPHAVAARLSFALWDSLPDAPLREAAAAGRLNDPAELRKQAERMARDGRAHAKLREFILGLLMVDHLSDMGKDPELFPGFNAEIASDMRFSLEWMIDQVLAAPEADFRRLLLAEEIPVNDRLAEFFGIEAPSGDSFELAKLDSAARAGVLTHPYLLAGFAYTSTSSPIHRGVFIARNLLGRTLRPPPEAVSPLTPDLHPDLTTRERTMLQTSDANCMKCHSLINPLGFTLEHFDAVGRYRTEEKGRPIEAAGSYLDRAGKEHAFHGARELARFLAENEESRAAVAERLFQYLAKQPLQAHGEESLSRLARRFGEASYNLRELMVESALLAALPPED